MYPLITYLLLRHEIGSPKPTARSRSGLVAQLVERQWSNSKVTRSNPTLVTVFLCPCAGPFPFQSLTLRWDKFLSTATYPWKLLKKLARFWITDVPNYCSIHFTTYQYTACLSLNACDWRTINCAFCSSVYFLNNESCIPSDKRPNNSSVVLKELSAKFNRLNGKFLFFFHDKWPKCLWMINKKWFSFLEYVKCRCEENNTNIEHKSAQNSFSNVKIAVELVFWPIATINIININ